MPPMGIREQLQGGMNLVDIPGHRLQERYQKYL
jgi:hypothetical protein